MIDGLLHRVPGVLPTPPNLKNVAPPLLQSYAGARLPFGCLLAPSLLLSPSVRTRSNPPSTRDAADHCVEIAHTNVSGARSSEETSPARQNTTPAPMMRNWFCGDWRSPFPERALL
jgi:hypothetical protein